uniref:Nucleotid_trans domain-containing protein n=1 Tax=Rhabditophanes sp. KR3021 TaxID=114890 RepID=A0AC35U458_9BILA
MPKQQFKNNYSIAIITIINTENVTEYSLALQSMKCYAIKYNYRYVLINVKKNTRYSKSCKQTDFMYQRHCVLANYLDYNHTPPKYFIFIDADIGVVNPNHLLESFLPRDNENLVFYERMYNHEIMAGSFIGKNTIFTQKFLMYWADYDFKKPKSFDGSDNAAIHNVFVDLFGQGKKKIDKKYQHCMKLWKSSRTWQDIRIYVACMRNIINNISDSNSTINNEYLFGDGKVKVLKKENSKRWSRDIWLLNSIWAPSDFLLHDLKMSNLNTDNERSWTAPWNTIKFNMKLCHKKNNDKNWYYNDLLIRTNKYVTAELFKYIGFVGLQYKEDLKRSLV